MKTKRTFISIFTLCVALLLTACNGNGTSDTENSQNTQTESSTDSSDIPIRNWMICISRKTSSLQIIKTYGTKHLS